MLVSKFFGGYIVFLMGKKKFLSDWHCWVVTKNVFTKVVCYYFTFSVVMCMNSIWCVSSPTVGVVRLLFFSSYNEHLAVVKCDLEKAMAPHSSTLAWKIPWMEEPSRLQSMGSLRVRHDWATSFALLTFMHWRRKWQPTPVFLPGESQGRGSLVGCRLWGRTESDTTQVT